MTKLAIRYKSTSRCRRCGGLERYTKNRGCVTCCKRAVIRWNQLNPESANKHRQRWKEKHPERVRILRKEMIERARVKHDLTSITQHAKDVLGDLL